MRSTNCKKVNHCTAKDGVCVSSGKRAQEGGGGSKASGPTSTKVGSLF
jgi:hypothetical protein